MCQVSPDEVDLRLVEPVAPSPAVPAVARRLPRWSEVRPLIQLRPTALRSVDRRLARASTIGDLRDIARRQVPRSVFDYVDGAAGAEIGIRRARRAFEAVEFHPNVLRDVSHVDISTTLVGTPSDSPLILAPTGFTRMMHHVGEPAVARAAAAAGIPYTLSTMGTTSPKDVASAAPHGRHWFQLYVSRDTDLTDGLLRQARESGFTTLVITVDTPVAGQRLRDVRNGLTVPPSLTPGTLAGMSVHPRWWFNLLTTEPLNFAALSHSHGTVADLVDRLFDPTFSFEDIDRVRQQWDGPVVVKGVQSADDAARLAGIGVDGIVVSNHGGRQLDRVVAPLTLLPEVVAAVQGRASVLLDTGITDGGDVVAAMANGADGVMIGRAYLYGLMAGGEQGVSAALTILSTQITRTLQLLGVSSVRELRPEHARLAPSAPH